MATYVPDSLAPSHCITAPIPPDQFADTVRLLVLQQYKHYRPADDFTLTFAGATPSHISALDQVIIENSRFIDEDNAIDEANRSTYADQEVSLNHCHINYYGLTSGLLVVKMPGWDHERLAREITYCIVARADKMGLKDVLLDIGAARIKPASQGGKCKEPDSLFVPTPPRQLSDCGCTPSFAIEVGTSESLLKLRRDKDWWFDNTTSDEGVNTVLLVKRFSRHLQLELWQRGGNTPTSVVEVRSTTVGETGSERRWIATGPMIIPFEPILLREKGPGEVDFVLDEDFLAKLAPKVIW